MSQELVSRIPSPAPVPVPSYSFDQLVRMASAFAKSGLFGVKDESQALSLMLYAQGTGKHPATIMRDYHLINNQLAKKSEAMLRDFQASGGRVEWVKYEDDGCIAIFSHPLSPKPVTIDWDMKRAEKALLSKNAMYTKYTRSMFRSRCISEGVRTCAPDATEQMYTPEEVRQIAAEEAPEPVSISQAVQESAAQITHEIEPEVVEAMIMSMDVKTLPELTTAFGRAYTAAKQAGDVNTMKKLKGTYDDMKIALESEAI